MKLNCFKKIIAIPALLLCMILTGYLALIIVYSINEKYMEENMCRSAWTFHIEGSYHNPAGAQLDNFTDALMLLTASHPKNENIWKAAANIAHYKNTDMDSAEDPARCLLFLYGNNGETDKNTVFENVLYGRYWHGYLVILKPLLTFFTYPQIRMIMSLVQLTLFLLLVLKLVSLKKTIYIFPILIFWFILNPIATMSSMQFNTVLCITFSEMFLIANYESKWKNNFYKWIIFFLIGGAITSYFDLLTFPIVALGVPLTLWISLNFSKKLKDNIIRIVEYSFFWFIGYGGMWSGKWVISSIVTGDNIWNNVIGSIKYRTFLSNPEELPSTFLIITKQMEAFENAFIKMEILLIIIAVIFFVSVLKNRISINYNYIISCCIIACYPFLWYGLLKNHSWLHFWFTYRGLSVTIFAISMILVKTVEPVPYKLNMQHFRDNN